MLSFSTEDVQTIVSQIAQQERLEPLILNVLGPSSSLFTQNPFSIQPTLQSNLFIKNKLWYSFP